MKKIASILFILILFFSCKPSGEKQNKENVTALPAAMEGRGESFIPKLPDELNEISGMLIWDNLYWGFNDSGGDEILFGFDKDGVIRKEVNILNAENRDWESITQDNDFIYIGDFGNNMGNRKDLRIFKIAKNDIGAGYKNEVKATKIGFDYFDQHDFFFGMNSNPFDCEAMVEMGGKLYLFSKNWVEHTSELYRLPASEGSYHLKEVDSFNVNLLVTGADISDENHMMALVGYLDYKTYLWIFSDFDGDDFFEGKSIRYHLKNLDGAQTEGISFLNQDTVLISCEETKSFKQQVFLFDLKNAEYETHQGKR